MVHLTAPSPVQKKSKRKVLTLFCGVLQRADNMETTSQTSELKPCPFCGGQAVIHRIGNSRQSSRLGCEDCSCDLEANETAERTGSAWNRRADASQWIPVSERLPEEDQSYRGRSVRVLIWVDEFAERAKKRPHEYEPLHFGFYYRDLNEWRTEGGNTSWTVQKWMPSPEPPKL